MHQTWGYCCGALWEVTLWPVSFGRQAGGHAGRDVGSVARGSMGWKQETILEDPDGISTTPRGNPLGLCDDG